MRLFGSFAVGLLLVCGCRSTNPTVPIDTLVALDVERAWSTIVTSRTATDVALDAVLRNEGNVAVSPLLCAYSLQRSTPGSDGFESIASVECAAGGSGLPVIPPGSEARYTFHFGVAPTDLNLSLSYRLHLQIFVEGGRASQVIDSAPFTIRPSQ